MVRKVDKTAFLRCEYMNHCSQVLLISNWLISMFTHLEIRHWAGGAMACLFKTISKREFRDLTKAEETVKSAKEVDYLIIKPLGLGEDVVPTNEWKLQKKKYEDTVDINLAKLDCARFMVQEAINPTIHNNAVVIGGQIKGEK